MTKRIALLMFASLCLLLSPDAYAQEAQDSLTILKAPESWNVEQIPFPLPFAPELPYTGWEDIRFMPGWAKPESPEFWSYTFVWYLEEKIDSDAQDLERIIQDYFDGLIQVVRKGNGDTTQSIESSQAEFLRVKAHADERVSFKGHVKIYDAFFTKSPIHLNVKIGYLDCPEQNRHIVWFRFSPQAFDNSLWKSFQNVKLAVPCHN